MRKMLLISLVVLVVTIALSMLWYVFGAMLMLDGWPSLQAYMFMTFPEVRELDENGCNADGVCEDIDVLAERIMIEELAMFQLTHFSFLIFFGCYV